MTSTKLGAMWLNEQLDKEFGAGHGRNTRFIKRLAELGQQLQGPNLTIHTRSGLPITTLGSYEMMQTYAKALNCTMLDIKIGHGWYDLLIGNAHLEFDISQNADATYITQLIAKNIDDPEKLRKMRALLDVLES